MPRSLNLLLSAGGLTLLVVSLISCGTGSALAPQDSHSDMAAFNPLASEASGAPAAPAQLALPAPPLDAALPFAERLLRRGTAVGTLELPGSQVFQLTQQNAAVDAESHTCTLHAAAGELSWAMYSLENLLEADAPMVLDLKLSGEDPLGPCYVAVSDYSRRAWVWTSVAFPQHRNSLPLALGATSISTAGNVYVVVAVHQQGSLAIEGLELSLNCPAPPPDGFQLSDSDGVQVPVSLSWIDPAISFDPDAGGQEVFGYDGIEVQRASQPEGPWSEIAQLAPGVTSYSDPNSIVIPGGEYYYRLLTLVGGAAIKPGLILGARADTALVELRAKFTLSPSSGAPGVLVSFNALGSVVSGGPLKNVLWDYDGDGVWDKDTAPALTSSKTYSVAGRLHPRLKLVMDLGGGATRSDIVTGYLPIGDQRGEWSQSGRTGAHGSRTALSAPLSDSSVVSYPGTASFLSPAALADGTLLVPGKDKKLHYLRPDASLLRSIDMGMFGEGPPAVTAAGYVWLQSSLDLFSPRITCVWPDLSVHTWSIGATGGPPVVSSDGKTVYVSSDNKLYGSAEKGDGSVHWYTWVYSFPAGTSASAPALDSSGNIYVCAGPALYKLSPAGKLLWQKGGFSANLLSPSVGIDGTIYASMNDAPLDLFAFDSNGSNLWANAMLSGSERIIGPAASGADGSVYVTTSEGRVYAFSSLGGMPIPPWHDASAVFVSPPVIDGDGRIYLLSQDGTLRCLSSKLGLRFSHSLGESALGGGLAFGNDGSLYASSTGHVTGLR